VRSVFFNRLLVPALVLMLAGVSVHVYLVLAEAVDSVDTNLDLCSVTVIQC
jgi:hypothetical protein